MSKFPLITLAVIFLLFLSLTRLSLRVLYRRRGKNDKFSLEFSVWRGLLSYKLEFPVVEVEKTKLGKVPRPMLWRIPRPAFKINAKVEGKSGRTIAEEKKKICFLGPAGFMKTLTSTIRLAKKYGPVVFYLLRRIHLRRFSWQTEIGLGDPSHTGFLTGMAWAVKGFLLTVLYRFFSPGGVRPFFKVVPNFKNSCFNTVLDCILEVRIGYIILTGFRVLFAKLKKR